MSAARWAITGAAAALAGARVAFPELAERMDATALILLAVAALPWLGAFLSELKIPNVLEAKFSAVERRLEEAEEKAEAARTMGQAALLEGAGRGPEDAAAKAGDGGAAPEATLRRLAADYAALRGRLPGGPRRTAEMTLLFRRMIDAARSVPPEAFDAAAELRAGGDEARRLAGLAYLHAHPKAATLDDVIACLEETGQPFVQYWAIKTLGRVTEARGSGPSQRQIQRLGALRFARATDRAQALAAYLAPWTGE